jgi:ABC-type multidrug transport system ATPase subunit
MTVLQLCQVGAGPLTHVDVALPPGHHVFLGRPSDGTTALVEVAAGTLRPRRGRVLVAGEQPWSAPAIRRRIGALLQHEQLPPGRTVSDGVAAALQLRNDTATVEDVLGRLRLESWGKRRSADLSPADTRAIALALALSIRDAALLILHEPLSHLGGLDRNDVLRELRQFGQRDTCVVCTCASARDAALISDSVFLLERGRIARRLLAPGGVDLTPGSPIELAIRLSDARPLLQRLTQDPDVTAIRWDESAAPREILVRGPDASRVSLATLRAVRAAGCRVESIATQLPSLELARAAAQGLARAAYEQAYRTGHAAAQIPPPAPTPASPRLPSPQTEPPTGSVGPRYGAGDTAASEPQTHAKEMPTHSHPPTPSTETAGGLAGSPDETGGGGERQ